MKNKIKIEGYLNIIRGKSPILWTIPFDKNNPFYTFPPEFIRKYKLSNGVRVKCEIEKNRVTKILSICDLQPEKFAARRNFDKLIPINPDEKFDFGSSTSTAVRIIDLFTPIGKGARGLIVSPPRAGKTMLLEAIANELIHLHPKRQVIVLLIDERPEEVTSFKRNTKARVFHSSLDKGTSSHINLCNFLIKTIQAEVESGNDIVILIDSLARMSRAYNAENRNYDNRTMSGGLSSGAMELPRKLFGLARNIQNGGSCTILATILKDTGSRMDEVIFQEFKGTGNCEIILDKEIAEDRIFPALHLAESGTRKDELLFSGTELEKINTIRRKLLQMEKSKAIIKLTEMLEQHQTNQDFLKNV